MRLVIRELLFEISRKLFGGNIREQHMNDRPYEPPSITEIGSVAELTLAFKTFGADDGFIFVPGNITIGDAVLGSS